MYQNFIGVDISKNSFSASVYNQNEVKIFANDRNGFKDFKKTYLDQLPNSLVILETTGGFEINLIRALQKKNVAVHRANTLKVKHYIRSFGTLAKSDSIDARALACYGFDRQNSLEIFEENSRKKLQKLVERRHDLKHMLVQEKNRLKSPDQTEIKKSFQVVIAALKKEIENITKQIEDYCASDPILSEQRKTLETVDGIGKVISFGLMALMPELGRINRKKIVSLAGVAPHPYESGKKIGYRKMRGGRDSVKNILFMAALTASRSKSRLGSFYQDLVNRGKPKMVAIGALMRKILVIANARIKELLESKKIHQHG